MKEYILCAAIWFDDGKEHVHQPQGLNPNTGFVVCGRRHHNCFAIFAAMKRSLRGEGTTEEQMTVSFEYPKKSVQGFLTNLDRFVGREEAAVIAFEAGQIVHTSSGEPLVVGNTPRIPPRILFSEHLY